MNAAGFSRAMLGVQLALSRRRVLPLAAGLLLVLAACAWGVLVPRVAQEVATERLALARAQARARAPRLPASAPSAPSGEARLQAFRSALGDVRGVDASLQAIFTAGEQSHLQLEKADYKLAYDKAGHFWTYAVQLPVTGSYAAIRAFGERVLLAMPYASLDEIDFRRKDIGHADLEARVRFTLHLAGPPDAAAGATR